MKLSKAHGWALALVSLALPLSACGKKGAPLPPLLRVPAPVADATAMRVGDDVFVRFTVPSTNADGHTPADVGRVELYAITSDRPPTPEDDPVKLRQASTLIATEQVRRPLPPPPPVKPGEPEPPPLPLGPGVDQGAVVVLRDTLTADARIPVPLPAPEAPDQPRVEVEPLPGPLVAPTESRDPIRYYYAVPVSPSGRYGLAQAFMPVPLGTTSAAPSAPALTHGEKEITIRWTPPADARGVTPPAIPDVIPSKPIVPGPEPTMFDVYEVARDAPANQSPSLPVALTPGPVGALELTQPIAAFDVERCFFVRPVDILSGYHVRGPASPTACITPKDTFPPAAAKSLAAVASAGTINLIWEPSDSADVAGYLVLRGEAGSATLTPLTPAPISETTFVDRTARSGVTYTYAVVAVDKSGNRSEESNRVDETARDEWIASIE